MNKIFIATIICSIFSCQRQANISLVKDAFNVGKMKPGEEKTINVNVLNNGDENLIIDDIKAECGCTVVSINKKNIASNESAILSIAFTADTTKIKQDQYIEKIIVIKSNSTNHIDEFKLVGKIISGHK